MSGRPHVWSTMQKTILSSFLVYLYIFSGFAQAEDIEVCVDPYPPFKIVDSSGVVTGGVDIELTDALSKSMRLTPKYTSLPWARCLRYLENGNADLVSGITKNKEREKYLFYIEPPYKTKSVKVFYVNRGDEGKFQTYDDIYNSTIGILRNAKYFEKFDTDIEITKYELSDELNGFKMLKLERIDAFITTEEVGDYLIESNGYSNDFGKAEYKYNQSVAVYFALSKKSKYSLRLDQFEASVVSLNEKGVFQKILVNYLNTINE